MVIPMVTVMSMINGNVTVMMVNGKSDGDDDRSGGQIRFVKDGPY